MISWSGGPISFKNGKEGNRLLFNPMVGHILVPQLRGKKQRKHKVGDQGGTGDRLSVGLVLVHQPRGENEKKTRGGDNLSSEVLVVDVGLQGQPAEASFPLSREARTRRKPGLGPLRQPWRAKHGVITLDLSTAGRSGGRG